MKKEKILLINEYLSRGGAEIYMLNLMRLLKDNGYEVSLLCFDDKFNEKKLERNFGRNIKKIYNIKGNILTSKIDKIIFNPYLYVKIRKTIKEIKPDIIIINNIFKSPVTQFKSLEGYKVYQIVHDYSIICPKAECIKPNLEVCGGYKKENCIKCCGKNKNKLQLRLKLMQISKVENLRKKIVTKVISPSNCLNNYLNNYEYNTICINNPINIIETTTKENIDKFSKRNFLYVGRIAEQKGIFKFLDAFIQFSKDRSVQIELIGSIDTKREQEQLEILVKKCKKIKYLGKMSNEEVIEKMKNTYCVVVPSLWLENYPTTVLEAQSQKTIVLGSNRGGIPEMLANNKGYIFDILNKNDIIKKLEIVYELEEQKYKKIVQNAYDFILNNNSNEEYAKKIIGVIEK